MIGRQSGDHRPYDGRYPPSVCRRFFDKMSSTDRLAIVGRLTPDDRATFGRYLVEKLFKMSAVCRPIIGRPSPDASPTTKPLKIGRSVNETFSLGASTKKSSADQKICQNRCRRRPTIGRRRPIFPFLARQTVGLGNVTVVLVGGLGLYSTRDSRFRARLQLSICSSRDKMLSKSMHVTHHTEN